MKVLSWNPRGLGNPRGIHTLHALLAKEAPDVVFLQETRLNARRWTTYKYTLGFSNCFIVDVVGRSGGLAMLWKYELALRILNYSMNHVHAEIELPSVEGGKCVITGVYGHPQVDCREEVWALLKHLSLTVCCPRLVFGDFNEILFQSEKSGDNMQSEGQLRGFRAVLEQGGLCDLGFAGAPFTWCNNREGDGLISERLDRFLDNMAWTDAFPNLRVQYGVAAYSDHIPLWLDTHGGCIQNKGLKPFRFEAMWVGDRECTALVEKAWCAGEGIQSLSQVMSYISHCSSALSRWNRTSFGHVQKKLAAAQQKLGEISSSDPSFQQGLSHKLAREEVQNWLERDEIMWKQQSRVAWLRKGDSNSQFFHSRASLRRRKNRIYHLKDAGGIWREEVQMETLIVDYFQNLFSNTDSGDMAEVLSGVEGKVTDQMNVLLTRPYVAEEVEAAVKQMHPSKAPGPDGMSLVFFHKYWNVIGKPVILSVLKALNSGSFPQDLNHTFITLIPKKTDPFTVVDFRPISLCNVLYKILSKCIANRLKKIQPLLISESQCAFVLGR
ncbi:uncharacterized protein LOC122296867 [Carya illinoinensis]|uniref:uncharacterized protein LOC122296867 n=1 Tax=Carya illinoinensis TaxID=32201 RepID=UPI001C723916|nr:uncharacterized protein LOC122296867 [Carya illinoinensis]